jgi:hypothetical protein
MRQVQRFLITALAGLLFLAPGAFAKRTVKPAGPMKMRKGSGPRVYKAKKSKTMKPYYKGRH